MRFTMVAAATCLLSAPSAMAQTVDSTATAVLASPTPVTLQDFAGSLSVAVPPGRLVRTPKPPVAALLQRIDELRRRVNPDAKVPEPRTGADMPACPMPVVRIDTTALAPMPVVSSTGDLPVAGQLKGCDNPLRSR